MQSNDYRDTFFGGGGGASYEGSVVTNIIYKYAKFLLNIQVGVFFKLSPFEVKFSRNSAGKLFQLFSSSVLCLLL